jgi:hypothetical protein
MNFTRGRHHRVYFGEVSRIIVAIELNLFEVIRITPRLDQEIYRWIVRTSLYIKPQAFLLGNALLSYRHEFMLKCLSIFRFDSKHDFDMQWFFLHRVTPLSRKDEPRKTTSIKTVTQYQVMRNCCPISLNDGYPVFSWFCSVSFQSTLLPFELEASDDQAVAAGSARMVQMR